MLVVKPITTIAEFRAAKADIIARYGEALLNGDTKSNAALLKDLAPLAKYAKMPAEKLATALARAYVDEH